MKSKRAATTIAGKLTSHDWNDLKGKLEKEGSRNSWDRAINEFFFQRLTLRYLDPISAIQVNGNSCGEGFSIVTIQCALIEFLAATKIGKNYKYLSRGEKLGPHEYYKSAEIFTNFLEAETPFCNWFNSENSAGEFYRNVRCALLHEARTKGGWKIWAADGKAVDPMQKIIRRDELQKGILEYVTSYRNKLATDGKLQKAFIRKFDHLAID